MFEKERRAGGSGDSVTRTLTQRPAGPPYQTLCHGPFALADCLVTCSLPGAKLAHPQNVPGVPSSPCSHTCLLLPCSSPSVPPKPALPHPGSRRHLPDPSLTPPPSSLTPVAFSHWRL